MKNPTIIFENDLAYINPVESDDFCKYIKSLEEINRFLEIRLNVPKTKLKVPKVGADTYDGFYIGENGKFVLNEFSYSIYKDGIEIEI